ncbi:MAG: phosphate propanoyltransferase [Hespellia sp.]|nr:phosphate propanoyltransferase [Hespellia sp.]
MSIKIPIEISARHIHVSQKDFESLFGKGKTLTPKKELSQPGQYLAEERITIQGPRGTFENVAVLGPFRKNTQVELSITDTKKLGVPYIIRQSGDIAATPGCTLVNGEHTVDITDGVIVAKRHIHMTPREAMLLHVEDNDIVFVLTTSYERSLIYADVVVRVSPDFRLAMHVDTDEGNAFASDAEPFGVLLKLFDSKQYSMDKWVNEVLEGIKR